MTTTIEQSVNDRQSRAGDESLLRDLIQLLVLETVQEAVDRGLTSVEGGELAFKRLKGRGWDTAWMRLFGPPALAAQWRASLSTSRQKFYNALPETSSEPVVEAEVRMASEAVLPVTRLPALLPATEPPTEDAIAEPATQNLLPTQRVPAPQQAIQPVRHGREDSLSLLSHDQRVLLETQLTVAGMWTRAGELRRADVLTIMAESRQRMKSALAGYRQRRGRLRTLVSYYDNDAVDLTALVMLGRLSMDQLRDVMDAIR